MNCDQCKEYELDFNFCPHCGTPLTELKPLTSEQLKQMGGEPYWHVSLQGNGDEWRILDKHIARNPEEYYFGEYWIAFAHKPKTQPAPKKGGR